MINSIRVDRNVPMKTRDGVTLRADIYRPDDNNRYPAILIRTPYNKVFADQIQFLSPLHAAFSGYAMVIQDTRGRFASEGDYTFLAPEGEDGYDSVEWIAAEPWCDGNVGMTGLSYMAIIQWQTAMENPPHLKAIAPIMGSASGSITDTRRGGASELDELIGLLTTMLVEMMVKWQAKGKDISQLRKSVKEARTNPKELYNHLPLKNIPHFQHEELSDLLNKFLTASNFGDLNSNADLYWPYGQVNVPCFHVGGWYDNYAGSLFINFLNMQENGGSQLAREGQHLLCGPWVHGRVLEPIVGGLHFGFAASGVASFIMERHIAFFNKYLKGIDNPFTPPLRYFVMGINQWRNGDQWPLPQTQWKRFFLHSKGKANSAAGDGFLSQNNPSQEIPDNYSYDPKSPVPTIGGKNISGGTILQGPFDQTIIEKRNDVLCYTSDELKEDTEITGPLILHLFAASSARDTDFFVKLVDVYPNGSAYNIAEGGIRAKYRDSILKPKLLNPDEICEYVIDLAATSNVFKKGHRIRIDITSSNFPKVDRNMNTGNPVGEDAEGIIATQSIYHQSEYPSYIDLPVILSRL